MKDNYIILIEIFVISENIIDVSLLNKKMYNFYVDNKNIIGILKLKMLGFKKINKDFKNLDNYNKIKTLKHYDGEYVVIKNKPISYNDIFVLSAKYNHLEIVKLCLENGVDVNCNDRNALFFSCRFGNKKICRYLLDNNATLTKSDIFELQNFLQINKKFLTYLI